MKLVSVDPRTILVPEDRVTSYFDSETLQTFKDTIKQMGIIEPPIVVKEGDKLYLVDGLNRISAAITQGLEKLQVAVMEGSLADAMVLNLVTSFTKGRHKLGELVNVIGKLYSELNISIEDLVKRTGLPRTYIEDLILIHQLGPEVSQLLDEGRLSKGHALALVPVKDLDLRNTLLSQQLTYQWTVKGFQEHVQEVLKMRDQQAPQPVWVTPQPEPTLACHFCGTVQKLGNIKSVVVCPTCYGILYEALRQAQLPSPGQREP